MADGRKNLKRLQQTLYEQVKPQVQTSKIVGTVHEVMQGKCVQLSVRETLL